MVFKQYFKFTFQPQK